MLINRVQIVSTVAGWTFMRDLMESTFAWSPIPSSISSGEKDIDTFESAEKERQGHLLSQASASLFGMGLSSVGARVEGKSRASLPP